MRPVAVTHDAVATICSSTWRRRRRFGNQRLSQHSIACQIGQWIIALT
jgi:hypothetical protein